MRAFTAMRSFLMNNAHMFKRLETIEHNYLLVNRHLSEHDRKFEEVLSRLVTLTKKSTCLLKSKTFFVTLQLLRQRDNTDMSEAELVQLNKDHNCTLYTIQFITEDKGEYLRFYNRFKDDATYNEDLARIAKFVESIADLGALERFFRPEGKMNDRVCALPIVKSKLRLYCLRLSDSILILGNGGVKKTRTYDEDDELRGFVVTLQNFDKLIKEGVNEGTISITENEIETDKTFDI